MGRQESVGCGSPGSSAHTPHLRRFSQQALELNGGKARARILQIRSCLLSKYEDLHQAFEDLRGNSGDIVGDMNKEISREQFSRLMKEHVPEVEREDHHVIFDFLDIGKTGYTTLVDLQMACEASPPVKSVLDLRLKLIACGYSAMHQVIADMEATTRRRGARFDTSKRLSLSEFGAALTHVDIDTADEHQAIFSEITDQSNSSSTISLAEFFAALVALGPPPLLELMRHRLLVKNGNLQKACRLLAPDGDYVLMKSECFVERAVSHFGMTSEEAGRLFRLIDIDLSGSVCGMDIVRAFQLSEPSLLLELARKRLRQRWRSIPEVFALHKKEVNTYGVVERPRDERDLKLVENSRQRGMETDSKTLPELQIILSAIGLRNIDTAVLFKALDVENIERLTASDIVWGMRVCTPSRILEDMRLVCKLRYGHIRPAFDKLGVSQQHRTLEKKDFCAAVRQLNLAADIQAEFVYELLDRQTGGVFINELIIALDMAAFGEQSVLKPEQLALKVKQQVSEIMGHVQTQTKDHRQNIRKHIVGEGDRWPKKIPLGSLTEPKSYICSSLCWQRTYGKSVPLGPTSPSFTKMSSQRPGSEDTSQEPKPSQVHSRLNIRTDAWTRSRPLTLDPWTAPSGLQTPFQEHRPDLNSFTTALDLYELPPSRQRKRPLDAPRWAEASHQKMTQLCERRLEDDMGQVLMQNIKHYYMNAGQTLAADRESLQESAVSRYQEFKNMRAAGFV